MKGLTIQVLETSLRPPARYIIKKASHFCEAFCSPDWTQFEPPGAATEAIERFEGSLTGVRFPYGLLKQANLFKNCRREGAKVELIGGFEII